VNEPTVLFGTEIQRNVECFGHDFVLLVTNMPPNV
jgi:hypothetical protein